MPNNEHLPVIRTLGPDSGEYTWQCSCGTIETFVWLTHQGATASWLEHVMDESLRLSGLDKRYVRADPIEIVRG
jgi:hypothetical protein